MGEMPRAEGLQVPKAEIRTASPDRILDIGTPENDVDAKVEAGDIDIEKRKRAAEYATAIADLEAELERAKVAAGKAGDMAHNFDKLISSIKSEIAAKEIEFAGEAGTDIAN